VKRRYQAGRLACRRRMTWFGDFLASTTSSSSAAGSFSVARQNGAGKSTLGEMHHGLYHDEGDVLVGGREQAIGIEDAHALGSAWCTAFTLVPAMTVAEIRAARDESRLSSLAKERRNWKRFWRGCHSRCTNAGFDISAGERPKMRDSQAVYLTAL